MRPFTIDPYRLSDPTYQPAQGIKQFDYSANFDAIDDTGWPMARWGILVSHPPATFPLERARLGIPDDDSLWEFIFVNPPNRRLSTRWHGYYVDILGPVCRKDDPPDAPRFALYQPSLADSFRPPYVRPYSNSPKSLGHDVLTYETLIYAPPLVLLAWQQRVYYRHPHTWLEAIWVPWEHPTESSVRYQDTVTWQALNRVWKARPLLERLLHIGRPRDSFIVNGNRITREQFVTRVEQVCQTIHDGGERVTKERVIEHFPLPSVKRLTELLSPTYFDIPWKTLASQYTSRLKKIP